MADGMDGSRLPDEYDPLNTVNADTVYNGHHPFVKTEFNTLYQYNEPHKPALYKRIANTKKCQPGKLLFSLFPILKWLPKYRWKTDLFHDLVSGLTVAIMHIPQGMAYALLGGVPPIVGIYMAFFPVLMYFFMGTSRHISMGTFAVVCMMTSKSVILYSSADEPFDFTFNSSLFDENSSQPLLVGSAANMSSSSSYTPIQVATAVCFVVGIWQLVLGIFRLGVVSVLLSDTLVSGFTTGASVHVLSTQVVNLLGVNIPRHSGPLKVVYIFIDIFKNIQTANLVAIGISAITITILACYNEFIKPRVSKKLPIPIPMELMAVVAGTLVSMFTHLKENYGVKVVGGIPTGLPIPAHPPWALIPKILVDGLVIAIVAFSVNMSMASILARKRNYSVDANQELIASGCSNIFGSFFSCIPFAASLSRSLIQESVGGETQIASVVSCGLLLFVLLLIGPFFQPLPNCVLASIVVVALKGMFMQVKDLPGAWRLSPFDGMVWLVTFLSVVLLDIDYGLGIGVALSLLCVIIMGQRPKVCRLGHVPSTNIYLDITRYQAALEISGISIIQVAGGLHFANKDHVRHKIYRLIGNLSPVLGESSPKSQASCVILDMMSICFVDPSAIKTLLLIYKDLKSRNVLFCLADCSATVYERMVHCDFFSDFPDNQLFPTIHDAVAYAQQSLKS